MIYKPRKKKCKQCGKEFNQNNSLHIICSYPCYSLWTEKKEVEKTGWFQKSVVLLLCMGVGISIADWYGIQIPYIRQYAITSALQDNFSLEALRPDFMESMSSTVVATSTPSMNKKTDSLEKMDK